MKTIDLFRAGSNVIIKNMPHTLQKDIAIKLNDLHASEKTAATDLNDFLKGRKPYSLQKQERLSHILGYSHFQILQYGRSTLKQKTKIKSFKKAQRKRFTLQDGTTHNITTILKMAEEFLLSDISDLQLKKSYLIDDIVRNWKSLLLLKKRRVNYDYT